MGWRRHRESVEALRKLQFMFSDREAWSLRRKWYFPKRDRRIKIEAPKKCTRCGRRGRLHRDHVLALSMGGRDVAENLQYLCEICHRFKTAEEIVLHTLVGWTKADPGGWRRKMWECRLEVLRERNPPGAKSYHTYFADPRTRYELWYERPKRKPERSPDQATLEPIPAVGTKASTTAPE